MEYTTIKIDKITQEKIKKYSRQLKLTQGNFLGLILEIAEKNNFKIEVGIDLIKKAIQEENNVVKSFIKQNDKKIIQLNENLEVIFKTIEENSEERNDEIKTRLNQIIKVLLSR
jgi:hypothetical protein